MLEENETLPASDHEITSPEIVPDAAETVAVQVVEEPTLIAEEPQLTDVVVVALGTVKEADADWEKPVSVVVVPVTVTVTVYDPAAAPPATVKDPDTLYKPSAGTVMVAVHVGLEIRPPGEEDAWQISGAVAIVVVSVEPVIVTGVPAAPVSGVSVIVNGVVE